MKNNKRLRIVIVAAIFVVVIIAIIAKQSSNEGKQQAEATPPPQEETTFIEGEKLAEVKKYKGLEISNVKFKVDDTMTLLTADVYNATSKKAEKQWININVLDKEGKRITSIGGCIGTVEPGAITRLSSSILSNTEDRQAYDIEITEQAPEEEDYGKNGDINNTAVQN